MSEPIYRRCPDCKGTSSVYVLTRQGCEAVRPCERCHFNTGMVRVTEELMTRAEWEASVDSKRHETMLHRWTGRLLHGAGQYSDPSTVEVATKSQAMLRAALGVEGDGDGT